MATEPEVGVIATVLGALGISGGKIWGLSNKVSNHDARINLLEEGGKAHSKKLDDTREAALRTETTVSNFIDEIRRGQSDV